MCAARKTASPSKDDGDTSALPPPFDHLTLDEWADSWSTTLLSLPLVRASLFLLLRLPPSSASSHHSLPLHVLDLFASHPLHARFLLDHSTRCLPLINKAIHLALRTLYTALTPPHLPPHCPPLPPLSIPRADHVHIRPFYLPPTHFRSSINDIRSRDTGTLIAVTGSVTRTLEPRVYEYAALYACEKCRGLFYVYADEDAENRIELPSGCRAWLQPEANEGNLEWQRRACRSTQVQLTAQSLPRDVQMIRLQENMHRSQLALPRSIIVRLTDELCETVKTGDVVHVSGMVRRQWGALIAEQRVNVEPYIDAYHVDIVASSAASASVTATPPVPPSEFAAYWQAAEGRGLRARNHIVNCMAPSLVGLFLPKLACLLALIGGVKKEDRGDGGEEETDEKEEEGKEEGGREREKGLSIRGDIHVLLVGDAGVGKSVLLSSASLLSPRGVLTTGTGTTTAGLTVAAVRSHSRNASSPFTLEPGALVLADGGVCCIDEFNCISKADRPAVLEAMEQQTISVAKGGLVTTLSTRTSVIAALNPKGKYDHDVDLTVNTALGSPLLSRFDVILVLLDTRNEEWDEKVAQHLLHALPRASGNGGVTKMEEPEEESDDEDSLLGQQTQSLTQLSRAPTEATTTTVSHLLTQPWSVAQMQSYISHVKSSLFPTLSPSCQQLLTRYYQLQRRAGGPKQARINIRMLESLVRLTQAHARLMYRDECRLLDAVMAVLIMEHSALSCGMLAEKKSTISEWVWSSAMPTTVSALHVDFSARPEEEYERWEKTILDRLGVRRDADGAQDRRSGDSPAGESGRSAVSPAQVEGRGPVSFAAVSAAGMAVASIEAASIASSHPLPAMRSQRSEAPRPPQRSFPLPQPSQPSQAANSAAPLSRPPPPPLPSHVSPPAPPIVSPFFPPPPPTPLPAATITVALNPHPPVHAPAPALPSALRSSSSAESRGTLVQGAGGGGRPSVEGAEVRRGSSVTFALPLPRSSSPPGSQPSIAADPYQLPSQPPSQRRAPVENPFRSSQQPTASTAPAPPSASSGAALQPPQRTVQQQQRGAVHPLPSSSSLLPSSAARLALTSPAVLNSARQASVAPPHSAALTSAPHPALTRLPTPITPPRPAPSTLAPLTRPLLPSSSAFTTPARAPQTPSSFRSPPPLSAASATVTPTSSIFSPLSSLSSSSTSAGKEAQPTAGGTAFSAISLPSSFAAAVKFANPFHQPPPPTAAAPTATVAPAASAALVCPPPPPPARPVLAAAALPPTVDAFTLPDAMDDDVDVADGGQWLAAVPDEVIDALDLAM